MNILDVFASAETSGRGIKFKRLANSLRWRQAHVKSDIYPLELDDGRLLQVQQIMNGEINGIGTGANVWPAAHVLTKYLEKRYSNEYKMHGLRVCDIGCGTGVVGLAAAVLGATVLLTDLDCVLPLTNVNLNRCCVDNSLKEGSIRALQYDWGGPVDALEPPFDVILVSDCILPKLYSIEPLVQAVAVLMDSCSLALFSYEHRVYPYFDPRQEFRRLAALHGLSVETVPIGLHHEVYSSDEIEIWEVRQYPIPVPVRSSHYGDVPQTTAALCGDDSTLGSVDGEKPLLQSEAANEQKKKLLDKSLEESRPECSSEVRVLTWRGENDCAQVLLDDTVVHIRQQRAGDATAVAYGSLVVGGYLWSSAVLLARHILQVGSLNLSVLPRDPWSEARKAGPKTALELGAGCGLTSIALWKKGYSVIATDRAAILPLLSENISTFLASRHCSSFAADEDGTDTVPGCRSIEVKELDWTHVREYSKYSSNCSADMSKGCPVQEGVGLSADLVVMSDCLYDSSAVEPLLGILDQVCGRGTVLLLANEMRSALDSFLNSARKRSLAWHIETLSISESETTITAQQMGACIDQTARPLLLAVGCLK